MYQFVISECQIEAARSQSELQHKSTNSEWNTGYLISMETTKLKDVM